MSGKLSKEFEDLTSLSAALLMGNHLTPLRNVCTDQITVSTHKLQKLVDELQEHDRKLAIALLGVRDQLSPDDKSDTVPMPRELTDEQAIKAHSVDFRWTPAPEHIARIKAVYVNCVQALHPERGDSE